MKFSAFLPLTLLVVCQLAGELLARALHAPLPGTVVGAVLLLAALCIWPGMHARIAPFCHTLLRNMLLFYVPASVGMMKVVGDVERSGPVLAGVIVVSTWATAFVSAAVFDAVRGRTA